MRKITARDASMLNVARALIANPHVLCVHRPALAKPSNEVAMLMPILKEFVTIRGVAQDPAKPASSRRPRTLIYTSIGCADLKHADVIFNITLESVQGISHDEITEG